MKTIECPVVDTCRNMKTGIPCYYAMCDEMIFVPDEDVRISKLAIDTAAQT
jgi:hypothetical protein